MPPTVTRELRVGTLAPRDTPGHRHDIQGLRALAVSLVLLYHLWPNRLTGGFAGVDVFFVISGFLITSHLLNSEPSRGRDLAMFWMRRIRRLLPAALLVLTATLVASRLFAPDSLWKGTAHEAIASALYVENWKLASSAVDYLAAENAPSPLQHYWSLSVEEQFYAVWPILVLLCVLLAQRIGRSVNTTVLSGLVVVVVGSLAYSMYATATEPSSAYFVTPTRVWELGVGGILAALLIRAGSRDDGLTDVWRLAPSGRALLAWLGFAAIFWTAFSYTDKTPFPGYQALLPVLGTAAVIAAHAQGRGSPGPFISPRPVQFLGDISYSLYLWHWPLIVIVPHVSGGELGLLDKLVVLAVSIALAAATKTLVEDRFRQHAPGVSLATPYRFALAGMALVVGLSVLQIAEVDQRQEDARGEVARALDDPCFGARSMEPGSTCSQPTDGVVIPSTTLAVEDKSDAYADECWVYRPFDEFTTCSYGVKDAPTRIALVGNSHAGHWLPALQVLARQNNWHITTFLASQCYATTISLKLETAEFRDNCLAWGKKVLKATSGDAFDLVVTSERTGLAPDRQGGRDPDDVVQAGYEEYLRRWTDGGANILAIRDNPLPFRTLKSIPDCVGANPDDFSACGEPPSKWVVPDKLVDAINQIDSPRASVADLTDYFCDTVCPPVIGRAMVYFDASHITATYSRTLAPYLEPYVKKSLARTAD